MDNNIIAIVADLHLKIGAKKVPKDWQKNRFKLLAEELNNSSANTLIIAGDLLDSASPSIEEMGVMYDFLKSLKMREIILIPGNHEMQNKKTDCYVYIEDMLKDLRVTVIREHTTYKGIDFIPYNILHSHGWESKKQSSIAITHVRGAIPPHVAPEVDLARFSEYDTVFAGDLHSHTNCQQNILYPGSPFTTSFHRTLSKGDTGYFLLYADSLQYKWVELYLPQLLRVRVQSQDSMVATEYHHTIYELEAELDQLATVTSSDLLDKKIPIDLCTTDATLTNLTGNLEEDLGEYLVKVKKVPDAKPYITLYKEVVK